MARVFSMAFDMVLICLIFTFLEPLLKKIAMELTIKDMLAQHKVNISDSRSVAEFFGTYAMKTSSELKDIFLCFFVYLTMEIILLLGYLIIFWRKFGATPAKMFMRLQIVDQDTFEPATTWQLLLRAVCALFAIFGIWFIPFTKKSQALHDIVAGTVVVKA